MRRSRKLLDENEKEEIRKLLEDLSAPHPHWDVATKKLRGKLEDLAERIWLETQPFVFS